MKAGAALARRQRGEPLVVLMLVFGGWLAIRVLLWQPPFGSSRSLTVGFPSTMPPALASANATGERGMDAIKTSRSGVPRRNDAPVTEAFQPALSAVARSDSAPLPPPGEPPPATRVVAQQVLLAAALSRMELAPEIAARLAATAASHPQPSVAGEAPLLGRTPAASIAADGRWSGDAWLLVRNDASGPLAAAEPSYGRSQAGAVLRYRLAPASGHRPVAYARVTRALAGAAETELAAGLSARPVSGVPISLAAEGRVREGPDGREFRPSAFAVTELLPAELPLGWRAEAYAQAGYVGGRFATAFVDGQARVDTRVAQLEQDAEVRVGGGLWGGAQKHAARLDIGPGATVGFRLGEARARLALDYRLRVAGDAAPDSGPALTISAGF